jgi:hypothetical protein
MQVEATRTCRCSSALSPSTSRRRCRDGRRTARRNLHLRDGVSGAAGVQPDIHNTSTAASEEQLTCSLTSTSPPQRRHGCRRAIRRPLSYTATSAGSAGMRPVAAAHVQRPSTSSSCCFMGDESDRRTDGSSSSYHSSEAGADEDNAVDSPACTSAAHRNTGARRPRTCPKWHNLARTGVQVQVEGHFSARCTGPGVQVQQWSRFSSAYTPTERRNPIWRTGSARRAGAA